MIRAAIAIGSNSTRMLCADIRDGCVFPLVRGREETRLFMGLGDDLAIQPDAMERVVRDVARLKAMAAAAGCSGKIALYATSATRDAVNAEEMIARLKAETGLELETISGQEEAELAYLAVSQGEDRLVIDIGGGSTELVLGRCGRPAHSVSLQLGASRLLKRFPLSGAAEAEALTGSIAASPEVQSMQLLPLYRADPLPACGIGGTMTAFRDMIANDPLSFPDAALNEKNARALTRLLAQMPIEKRMTVPGLPPARAVHIVHGLCILTALLSVLDVPDLQVSRAVNLDGWMWREAQRLQKATEGQSGGLES